MQFPNVDSGPKKEGKSNLFVQLKNGDKINGVFRGDPRVFKSHWVNRTSLECSGDSCEVCHEDKPKFRFQLNIVTKVDGVYMAKIFEGSFQTYIDLKGLHETGYNLEETAVTVSRIGEKTETRYSILPMPKNGGLTEADFKAIAAIPLNQLRPKQQKAGF